MELALRGAAVDARTHPPFHIYISSGTEPPSNALLWRLKVTLMTEFCLIHDMIVACGGPCSSGTNHSGGTYPFKQPQIINFFGTVSCILWLQGFILLMYWNIYEVPPAFLSVVAVAFKIIASCFFNVQPASGLLMQVPLGVDWSNFVGICLFHTGTSIVGHVHVQRVGYTPSPQPG